MKENIPQNVKKIWKEAVRARQKAHAPYSEFKVGAAFQSGKEIFSGCNIENASYGATLCAERVAIFKAVSEGKTSIQDLVVVADTDEPTPPCGLCLQVIAEFCSPYTRIWMASSKKIYKKARFSELLTTPFVRKNLR